MFKYKNVWSKADWVWNKKPITSVQQVSTLIIKDKWYGDEARLITGKQYGIINSESFKIAMYEFHRRLIKVVEFGKVNANDTWKK